MKFSDPTQEVETEYQRRFGKVNTDSEKKADKAVERELGEKVDDDRMDVDKDKEMETDSGKTNDKEGEMDVDSQVNGAVSKGKEDEASSGEEEEEEGRLNDAQRLALSRCVAIAKELFAKKSPEARAAIQAEAQEHYDLRQAAYEKALTGEDWYDADLLPEYVLYIISLA